MTKGSPGTLLLDTEESEKQALGLSLKSDITADRSQATSHQTSLATEHAHL